MIESRKYRLNSMPYAKCFVMFTYTDNKLCKMDLFSYSTNVVSIYNCDKKWFMDARGPFTHTTIRHINNFTKEFFGSNQYYLCKTVAKLGLTEIAVDGDEWSSQITKTFNNYMNDNMTRPVKRYYDTY